MPIVNVFNNVQSPYIFKVFPKKDVGSFVVINFSSVDVGNSGGVLRENDWVHNKFHDPCLDGKPKILISFRYK